MQSWPKNITIIIKKISRRTCIFYIHVSFARTQEALACPGMHWVTGRFTPLTLSQSITWLTHIDRHTFTLAFTATGNLEPLVHIS